MSFFEFGLSIFAAIGWVSGELFSITAGGMTGGRQRRYPGKRWASSAQVDLPLRPATPFPSDCARDDPKTNASRYGGSIHTRQMWGLAGMQARAFHHGTGYKRKRNQRQHLSMHISRTTGADKCTFMHQATADSGDGARLEHDPAQLGQLVPLSAIGRCAVATVGGTAHHTTVAMSSWADWPAVKKSTRRTTCGNAISGRCYYALAGSCVARASKIPQIVPSSPVCSLFWRRLEAEASDQPG
jgi:hypothetical protein